jgi:ATP-dependent Zn protease
MKSSREATAYHEAGHAVTRYYLHLPIRKVTIRPDKERGSLGHCESKGSLYLDGIDMHISPAKQDRIFRNIKVLLAGNVAQRRFSKRNVRNWHASGDYRQIVDLAMRITSPDGVQHLVRWLRHETEWIVQRRWREIEAVAEALFERETLTGDEVGKIINDLNSKPIRA